MKDHVLAGSRNEQIAASFPKVNAPGKNRTPDTGKAVVQRTW